MTRKLASELAPPGIRVNQVTPGGTRTPIWSAYAPTDDAMAALETRIARGVPLGRLGEADEVAKAVFYLASHDASNVTGTELVVDGGRDRRSSRGANLPGGLMRPCPRWIRVATDERSSPRGDVVRGPDAAPPPGDERPDAARPRVDTARRLVADILHLKIGKRIERLGGPLPIDSRR